MTPQEAQKAQKGFQKGVTHVLKERYFPSEFPFVPFVSFVPLVAKNGLRL